MNNVQWYTESIYVDSDTGEQITKKQAKENYQIVNKTKKTKINETPEKTIGIITYIYECKKSRQIKLFE